MTIFSHGSGGHQGLAETNPVCGAALSFIFNVMTIGASKNVRVTLSAKDPSSVQVLYCSQTNNDRVIPCMRNPAPNLLYPEFRKPL